MKAKYEWVTYGHAFYVPQDSGVNVKKYGLVKRGGRKFYRNYKRSLKNGKGVSFLWLLEGKIKLADANLRESLGA